MRFERNQFSIEAGLRKGRPLPQWYLEEPPIPPWSDFFLQAFSDLSTCRDHGMGFGPIPWDKIIQYGYRAGLDDDMIDVLNIVLRLMDGAFLDQKAEEAKKR